MEVKHIFALNCPEPNLQIADPQGQIELKTNEDLCKNKEKNNFLSFHQSKNVLSKLDEGKSKRW